jgi:ribose transport system substrate-binding protein
MAAGRRSSLAVLAVSLALASCSGERKRTIAVVPKATSHLFWVTVEEGVRAAGRDLDVDVIWNGAASETDYARQVQIVDSMISRRVDGLAVAATERKILVSSIDRAMAAGIPVVVFDSGVDTENITSFLATNNYEGGAMAARELAKAAGARGEIGLLMHAPGSTSTMDREAGFEETLTKEFPEMRIVTRQYSMSDRAKGRAAAENMLTANPSLAGVFASAEPGSVGAALAIKARARAGKVKLVTFDSSDTLLQDCRDGVIQAMVVQDPFQIGYQAVKTVVDKLNGLAPPSRVDLPARVLHMEDCAKQ